MQSDLPLYQRPAGENTMTCAWIKSVPVNSFKYADNITVLAVLAQTYRNAQTSGCCKLSSCGLATISLHLVKIPDRQSYFLPRDPILSWYLGSRILNVIDSVEILCVIFDLFCQGTFFIKPHLFGICHNLKYRQWANQKSTLVVQVYYWWLFDFAFANCEKYFASFRSVNKMKKIKTKLFLPYQQDIRAFLLPTFPPASTSFKHNKFLKALQYSTHKDNTIHFRPAHNLERDRSSLEFLYHVLSDSSC